MLAEAFQPRGRIHRIKNWTRFRSADLWCLWREQFNSDDDAIATAVWMANRMVKDKARSTRQLFYSIKDEFIRRYAVAGVRVREEVKSCWDCDGSGIDPWNGDDEACGKRGGSGIYASRWLYLHEFDVAGRHYKFHSYVEPKVLLAGVAGDAEHYGERFTEEEERALALPMTGLLRLLTFIAATKWGMRVYARQYR